MEYKQAIETIKGNYPPENYTMLREALDLAIEVMQEKINENNLDDFQGMKTIKVKRG
jgi:predicted RNase H-like HicB family nuclease